MKKLKHFAYLFLAILFMTSCEKETTTLPENSQSDEQLIEFDAVNKELILKQLIENFQKSKGNVASREAVSYKGELCGTNITGWYADGTDYQTIHNYYFNGIAGNVISIYVPRTTIGFDSAFHLYYESMEGNVIVDIWHDDDVANSFGGCYGDPYLGNYTLPYSGLYTLSIVRAASCGFPYGYEIITTGISCGDYDNDGVLNEDDLCANTPIGETVNSNGCSQSQLDDDNDGIMNSVDNCSNTPVGESVDENGCGQSQLDYDGDGVMNNKDANIYSILGGKINILDYYLDIDNVLVKNGSTMMDQITDLIAEINAQYNGENYTYLHKMFMTYDKIGRNYL
ncbi:MAG: hypothetical protein GZ086_13675 [Gelidibacter sp.]|nr:hypothetical protein [Gelidibacter sp.]